MRRNILSLVIANALFGLAFGVFDLAFPLFLKDSGVSLEGIGLVMAAGAVMNFLLVVYGGRLADLMGRKRVYVGSFIALAAVNAATPLVPQVAYLAVIKTLHAALVSARMALRGVLVYESVAVDRFTRVFGQLVGMETGCHALGYLCVSAGGTLTYQGLFAVAAVALTAGAVLFWRMFRDNPAVAAGETVRLSLRGVFRFDLHRQLYLIIAAGLLFEMGIGMSHTLWPLYFRDKFDGPWAADLSGFESWLQAAWPWAAEVWTGAGRGAKFALVSLIAIFHRFLMGASMFLVAPMLRRHRKWLYVGCLVMQGAMIASPAVLDWAVGSFILVAIAWVTHDIVGAAVWYPIRERYIQQFSRPDRRATDVAKANALMVLGMVFGQALAGPVMVIDPAAPFFAGGALILAASAILLAL